MSLHVKQFRDNINRSITWYFLTTFVSGTEIYFHMFMNVNLYITCSVGVITPIAQIRRLGHKEVKKHARMRPPSWSLTLNPRDLSSAPVLTAKTPTT